MDTTPESARSGTRELLLAAAAEVFAERGFQLARIRDIAARANTNLSAINYHFGSKRGLYETLLQELAQHTIERYPLLPPGCEAQPAEQRFHHLVRSLLHRFISPHEPSQLARLMSREMATPTPALERLVEQISKPQFAQMATLVAELLGPAATPERVRRCTLSVFGQCILYLFGRPVIRQLTPETYESEGSIDRLATHIAEFSLGALKALRAGEVTP